MYVMTVKSYFIYKTHSLIINYNRESGGTAGGEGRGRERESGWQRGDYRVRNIRQAGFHHIVCDHASYSDPWLNSKQTCKEHLSAPDTLSINVHGGWIWCWCHHCRFGQINISVQHSGNEHAHFLHVFVSMQTHIQRQLRPRVHKKFTWKKGTEKN